MTKPRWPLPTPPFCVKRTSPRLYFSFSTGGAVGTFLASATRLQSGHRRGLCTLVSLPCPGLSSLAFVYVCLLLLLCSLSLLSVDSSLALYAPLSSLLHTCVWPRFSWNAVTHELTRPRPTRTPFAAIASPGPLEPPLSHAPRTPPREGREPVHLGCDTERGAATLARCVPE